MEEIVITNAVALYPEKLTIDNSIIKGKPFYFGKITKKLPKQELRCNSFLQYLADKLDLSKFNKADIGVVIATTNSGIEEFISSSDKHHAELGNPAEFLKNYLGLESYATSVSTACTSGIKAFSLARKLLENNICKAVIVGGVDTIASTPSYGFHALEVFSQKKNKPFF